MSGMGKDKEEEEGGLGSEKRKKSCTKAILGSEYA